MSDLDDLSDLVAVPPHGKPAGQGRHLLKAVSKGMASARDHGRVARMLAQHHKPKPITLATVNLPDLPAE